MEGTDEILGLHAGALYLDLEFTCWDAPPPPGMKQEVIEIGIVSMDLNSLIITDEASFFVRPKRWEISPKCTGITGITTEDIQSAKPLSEVMAAVERRFSPASQPCFTWGDDVQVLAKSCIPIGLKSPFRKGGDLSTVFQGAFALKERSSLRNAISYMGRSFDGFPHGALPDARNTAHVHAVMLKRLRKDLESPVQTRPSLKDPIPLSQFAHKLAACLDREA